MSPTSNIGLNEMVSWKGRTFNQITSQIRKNGAVNSSINLGSNIFMKRGGRPLKIYRREIVVPTDATCNVRTSMRMDLYNAPGGSIDNSAISGRNVSGLVNMVDFNVSSRQVQIIVGSSLLQSATVSLPYPYMQVSPIPTNTQDPSWSDAFSVNIIGNQLTVTRIDANAGWGQPLTLNGWVENECTLSADCVAKSVGNTQSNALRRLRSGGMVKKQFDISTNKQTYYTNSQQYVNSRNRGFSQNQFYYTRIGDSSAKPGDSLSTNNIYTTNTVTNCKKIFVSAGTSFKYQWVNEMTYVEGIDQTPPAIVTVNVPSGYYNIIDLNHLLHNTMTENRHYYRRLDNLTKVFLMEFRLNATTGRIELTVSPISAAIVQSKIYGKALKTTELGVVETTDWTTPSTSTTPQIIILDNEFKTVIGFAAGSYPLDITNTTDETFIGTSVTLILPEGNRVYYKPNNPQFAQQGAVTSGSRIARLRYDTITNSAASYRTAYGLHVSNALAYGVPANGYTIKDKIGYPNPNTPVVTATGEMRFCK